MDSILLWVRHWIHNISLLGKDLEVIFLTIYSEKRVSYFTILQISLLVFVLFLHIQSFLTVYQVYEGHTYGLLHFKDEETEG